MTWSRCVSIMETQIKTASYKSEGPSAGILMTINVDLAIVKGGGAFPLLLEYELFKEREQRHRLIKLKMKREL